MLRLERIVDSLPDSIGILADEARAEAIRNVDRLVHDWSSGVARFTRSGELLLAAFDGADLVAIGGLTVEPDTEICAMRLRRLYVRPAFRRRGVGRTLAVALMEQGFSVGNLLTLNAGVPGSAQFWEALGFTPVHAETRTHEMRRDAVGGP